MAWRNIVVTALGLVRELPEHERVRFRDELQQVKAIIKSVYPKYNGFSYRLTYQS